MEYDDEMRVFQNRKIQFPPLNTGVWRWAALSILGLIFVTTTFYSVATDEVGVVKKKNGEGYELLWDFFAGGNGLQKIIGGKEDCNRLVNEYNRAMMENVAESQGLALEEEDYDEVTGEAVMYLCEYE